MGKEITFGAGFSEPTPHWHLRKISMAEEREYLAGLAEVREFPEEEQTKELTQFWIEKIAEWSVKPPTKIIKKKHVNFYDDSKGALEDVNRYFNELDPDDAARLANSITLVYQNRLQPNIVF